ncbi:ATP-binding protein [Methanofollis sp. UBA420]|jgi:hypothetical protein|uniref:ATP-binding protein n=1 Tax=Methanofollis sp. UBA420 TaxID=1915514 RepID=UPI00316AD0CB
MTNIDDLIEFDNENRNLDFKGAQYIKENHEDFIKDLISMANAETNDERYIVIGIVQGNEGEKELRGIEKKDFIDDAVYQQLIRENVEPDINFEYFLHEYNRKYFGVFRIENCTDKPYMMKKDYRRLKKGDSWIRKGSHQPRMVRRDLDNIYEQKTVSIGFNGPVEVLFEENRSPRISIPTAGEFILPSERKAKNIHQAIEEKKNPIMKKPTLSYLDGLTNLNAYNLLAGIKPYSERTLEELEENLKSVKEDFADDDIYFCFEEIGYKLNLVIENKGEQYIEDGQIHVWIPKEDGLLVASKVPNKPNKNPFLHYEDLINAANGPRYPRVTEFENYIVVKRSVGNIKHHIPIIAFEKPVRIFFSNVLTGKSIEIICEIFGKNLKKSLLKTLIIDLIEPKTND